MTFILRAKYTQARVREKFFYLCFDDLNQKILHTCVKIEG
jgi:hypothetical protein